MLITKEKIKKDAKTKEQISALSVFALIGLFIPIIPFLFTDNIDTNTIISFVFFLLVFGIPFGYFIGLRKIIKTLYKDKCIKNDEFVIVEDTITDLYATSNCAKYDMDDSFCQLTLKYYSEKSGKNVSIPNKIFRKLKEGDKCTLIFVKNIKVPFLVYPGNEYEIDNELKKVLTT
jgi:hypothetical protein